MVPGWFCSIWVKMVVESFGLARACCKGCRYQSVHKPRFGTRCALRQGWLDGDPIRQDMRAAMARSLLREYEQSDISPLECVEKRVM